MSDGGMSHAEVYVYQGPGASQVSSSLLFSSLRRCLCAASYRVLPISPQEIRKGDWVENCAAVVFGGGYDLGFLDALGQQGTKVIRRYVLNGGTYLGICAGAYFACDYIQFEKGSKMEVCGPRPLQFYPGQCLGAVTPNFKYGSERGAAALPITVTAGAVPTLGKDTTLHVYVNGGGFFSPYSSTTTSSSSPPRRQVETLARFVSLDGQPAAVVRCEVGEKGGVAMLSSPHIEHAAFELNPTDRYLLKFQRQLRDSDQLRELFFRAFLEKGKLTTRSVMSVL
ncbi:uncharacterized protein LOC143301515 [Babylonia areolata]|uniref:uncharacterized protein LOC143301515 n=1 Tax=Babylonia areolata TaxID=304850 RepID=UPI003FD0F701